MIKIDNLSYSFPQKDLYKNVSFTLEEGQHCAFIGASGNGKSTLIDIIMDPENYMFDGKLEKDENCRIGYVSQFSQVDKTREMSVFEYIAEPFIKLQEEIASLCEEMGTSDDIETLLEKYQVALDAFDAIDGDNFENNINKKLNTPNKEAPSALPAVNIEPCSSGHIISIACEPAQIKVDADIQKNAKFVLIPRSFHHVRNPS